MTTKATLKSRILTTVHETSSDLHKAGFIDLRRMRDYDALCLAARVVPYRRSIERRKNR